MQLKNNTFLYNQDTYWMIERSTNKSKQVARLTHSEDIANNQNAMCDAANTSKQFADLVLCS